METERKELLKMCEGKKYSIIYADPAWKYKESWGNGQTGYKTMSTDEICKLPVKEITDDKAHLYLWVTNPFLADGLRVCKEWGFEYKTLLTWHKLYSSGKPEMGMGYYFRGCTEHIIFGVKGGMKCKTKVERNCIEYPDDNFIAEINPKQHSRKPDLFRNKIVNDWSGDLHRLEMFARMKCEGWNVWGNETDKFEEEKGGKIFNNSFPPQSLFGDEI